jgi:hypothetical protein
VLTPVQADSREIYVGQALEVSAEFRVKGEPKDPTVLYFRTKTPSGTTSTKAKAALDTTETGFWSSVVVVTEPGWWVFRFEGSGVADGVNELRVYVKPSEF